MMIKSTLKSLIFKIPVRNKLSFEFVKVGSAVMMSARDGATCVSVRQMS